MSAKYLFVIFSVPKVNNVFFFHFIDILSVSYFACQLVSRTFRLPKHKVFVYSMSLYLVAVVRTSSFAPPPVECGGCTARPLAEVGKPQWNILLNLAFNALWGWIQGICQKKDRKNEWDDKAHRQVSYEKATIVPLIHDQWVVLGIHGHKIHKRKKGRDIITAVHFQLTILALFLRYWCPFCPCAKPICNTWPLKRDGCH